jgi:hypothetical protein
MHFTTGVKSKLVTGRKCFTSVADPVPFRPLDPGSGINIPDPDFYPSRIPDPKTATKERGEKKLVVIPFYVATNFTKL